MNFHGISYIVRTPCKRVLEVDIVDILTTGYVCNSLASQMPGRYYRELGTIIGFLKSKMENMLTNVRF